MSKPTVAILGASTERRKYGNKSLRAHLQAGYEVFPINPKAREVEGEPAYATLHDVPVDALDRISVYLPPEVGLRVLDDIAQRGAKEVWFNPGSESPELLEKCGELGINAIAACSIVSLGLSPADFPDE